MADTSAIDDEIIRSSLAVNADSQTKSSGGLLASAAGSEDDEIVRQAMGAQVKLSSTGLTEEPMPDWQAGYKSFTDRLTIGGAAASKAAAGWKLAAGGSMEEARNQVNTQEFAKAQMDTQDYINSHGYQQLFKLRDLPGWDKKDETGMHMSDIPGWIIEQVPSLAQVGLGAGYGAIAGSVFGPAGVAWGAFVGTSLATGGTIFGSHVYDMMDRGVDKNHAVVGGAISGAFGGVATSIGFGAIGKVIPSLSKAVANSTGFRQTVTKVAGTLLAASGIDMAANDTQSVVDSLMKYWETREADLEQPYSLDEFKRDLVMAHLQGQVVGGAMTAGAAPIGIASGALAKHQVKIYEKMRTEYLQAQASKNEAAATHEAEAQAKRDARLAARIPEEQARARKTLKGFAEVTQTTDVAAAQTRVQEAELAHQNADKTERARTRLDLDLAKAELQQAKYQAKVSALEDALSDPDLVKRASELVDDLTKRVDTLEHLIEWANTDEEAAALKVSLKATREQLQEAKRMRDLGGEDAIRAEIEARKSKLDAYAKDAMLSVAKATLKKRIKARDKEIASVKADISGAKQAARIGGRVYWHGTSKKNARKIRKSGKLNADAGERHYTYSAYGPDTIYMTGEENTWLSKDDQVIADGRLVKYETKIPVRVSDKASIVHLDGPAEGAGAASWDRLAAKIGLTEEWVTARNDFRDGIEGRVAARRADVRADMAKRLQDFKEHAAEVYGEEAPKAIAAAEANLAKQLKEQLSDSAVADLYVPPQGIESPGAFLEAALHAELEVPKSVAKSRAMVNRLLKAGVDGIEIAEAKDSAHEVAIFDPTLVEPFPETTPGGAQTDELRGKLEKLQQQQELDGILQALIEDGNILPEDVKDLRVASPITKLFGLVDLAKKQVDRAASQSASAKKKAMVAAKKLLDAVVDASRLPKEDKNALKAIYANVDFNKLQEVMPALEAKILEQFNARRLQAARTDLNRQLKRIGTSEQGTISKTPGTEELLITIKEFAGDINAVDRLLLNLEEKESISDLDEARLELTNLFPVEIKEMSAAQLEAVLDTIVELRETGGAEALRRIEERQQRQSVKIDAFKRRIRPKKGTSLDARRWAIGKWWDNHINSEISTWRGLMTMASQFGSIHTMEDILDVKTALSNSHKMRIQWENKWKEMVTKHGMSTQAWHKFNIKANKRGDKLTYLKATADMEGKTISDELVTLEHPNGDSHNLWELIQIRNYLLDSDPDAVSRFSQGNRFSYPGEVSPGYSTIEVVESYLNDALPGWDKVADSMRDFYKEFHSVVEETAFRRFGRRIEMNDTYGGELISSSEPGSRFRETFRRATLRPNSARARQGGSSAVVVRSAMDNLKNHIAQYSREHHMVEIEQDMQAIFMRDQDVRNFIERNIGVKTRQAIDKFVEDIILGYNKSYSSVDKIAGWLRESIYSRFLGARPEQFAKQLTGFIHALQFVGPKAMIEGYSFLMAHPEEAHAMMQESGLFQARASIRDPDFKPGASSSLRRFNSLLMHSVAVGDLYAVYGAGFPVLLHEFKKTGNLQAAIKAFETAFDTTQSSGSIDELPNVFRGNPLLRLFTVMAQEPTRQVEAINTAWRKWKNKPSKETYGNYLRVVGVTYAGAALYNLVGFMVLYPLMKDEEAKESKLTYILDVAPLGPFSGVAMLGQLLSSLTVQTLKVTLNQNTKAYEPELLATDPLGDAFVMFAQMLKISSEGGDAEDYWNAMLAASNFIGDVTGLPSSNILSKLKPFLGVD